MTEPLDFTPVKEARAAELKELRTALFGPRDTDEEPDDADEPDRARLVVPAEGSNPRVTGGVDEATRLWVSGIFNNPA